MLAHRDQLRFATLDTYGKSLAGRLFPAVVSELSDQYVELRAIRNARVLQDD